MKTAWQAPCPGSGKCKFAEFEQARLIKGGLGPLACIRSKAARQTLLDML